MREIGSRETRDLNYVNISSPDDHCCGIKLSSLLSNLTIYCVIFGNSPELIIFKQILYSTMALVSNNAAGSFSNGRNFLRNFSTT